MKIVNKKLFLRLYDKKDSYIQLEKWHTNVATWPQKPFKLHVEMQALVLPELLLKLRSLNHYVLK